MSNITDNNNKNNYYYYKNNIIQDKIEPLAPLEPITPLEPLPPLAPLAPLEPLEPLAPLAPLAPLEPLAPLAPLEPLAPIQFDDSVSPIGPIHRLEPLQSFGSMPSLEPIPRIESFGSMPALESLESDRHHHTVRYEFNQNTHMTRRNFPSATQLRQFCDENNFSSIINMLKNKIFSVNSGYPTSIHVMINDTSSYPPESVIDVKNYLNTRGFNITEIENDHGIYQGWKLSW